jgi:hypothetical protein
LARERFRTTQDFILVNHDTFFLRDAMEVAAFAQAVTTRATVRGAPLDVQLRALRFFLERGDWRGLTTLYWTLAGRPANPLALTYWGQTPYALGRYAVKYLVCPQDTHGLPTVLPRDGDALEDAVEAALAHRGRPIVFDLKVQRQTNDNEMPIEDPTVAWSETQSPYQKVATIEIPRQAISSQRRRNFGEHLSFTPWHTTWAHRPLGGINRMRRAVYEASSDLRHDLNGAPMHEPGGHLPGYRPPPWERPYHDHTPGDDWPSAG